MLPQEPYKKFAVVTLYVSVGIALLYILFHYLWGAVLPFIIAYLFAECFRPIVKYSESHKNFPKKSVVLFVVLLATGAIIMLIYAVTRQIFIEISELTARIKETVTLIRTDENFARETINKICNMIPFVDLHERLWEMRANLDEELWNMLISLGENMSGTLISFVGTAAAFIPKALFATIVVIFATYYFALDRVRINNFFLSLFPKKTRPLLKSARDTLAEAVGKYLRAYGLLFLITFGELLLAFMFLDVEYSFVLALVISLVDVLPVLGTGTVLIPWGIIALIIGNYGLGIGLLITYAITIVIRQVIEPKIIGKFIGLSPIAALASMYIGLKLMGLLGLFAFPLGAILIKRIYDTKNSPVSK
ncbi:MAG: sporulation integral membrane protein YtvI [Clostridia bacterium]|nr:sporulation integral membrane protein YtvI [Clostridia bacterium]